MAQVVVTRPVHGSFVCSRYRSAKIPVEKLKRPSGFPAKVYGGKERKSERVVRSIPVIARRSARAETEVLPVSPEDVLTVVVAFLKHSERFFLFPLEMWLFSFCFSFKRINYVI